MRRFFIYATMSRMKWAMPVAMLLLFGAVCSASVTIPAIFSDHMVLQQNSTVTVWGWGKPGEVVTITGSWDPDRKYTQRVPNHSAWSMEIETPGAGGPFQLLIRGYNVIEINDVLIGEVWLGSGQSNMEWSASPVLTTKRKRWPGLTIRRSGFSRCRQQPPRHPNSW